MKRILLIVTIIVSFTACGTYNSVDSMSQLRSGMTKGEVEYYLGQPIDVLTVNYTQNGIQEVLAFRNNYDEVYAVEFWDNYLTGYEYLYDDIPYMAPAPPTMLPPAGRPIIVAPGHGRPNRPGRPSRPSRPAKPNRPSRPNNDIDRPYSRPGNSSGGRLSNDSGRTSGGRSSNSRYNNRTSSDNNSTRSSTNTTRESNSNRTSSERTTSSSSERTNSARTSSERSGGR